MLHILDYILIVQWNFLKNITQRRKFLNEV